MAEGFANRYGGDVLIASSSGLAPTQKLAPETAAVMMEVNVDISRHVPTRYDPLAVKDYDLVVNMAGFRLPGPAPKAAVDWEVTDPYRSPAEVYRAVRGDLENRVMRLILEFRKQAKQQPRS